MRTSSRANGPTIISAHSLVAHRNRRALTRSQVRSSRAALRAALERAIYRAAGSRRAQTARRAALRAEGFDDAALERIHGPVGLDIGGATTAETAISILAEIVATRSGRRGTPLLSANGAIH